MTEPRHTSVEVGNHEHALWPKGNKKENSTKRTSNCTIPLPTNSITAFIRQLDILATTLKLKQ